MTTLYDDRPVSLANLAYERACFNDHRLGPVLRGLTAHEAEIALRWAVGGACWEQAAVGAGLPEAYGERVRRKLKRLGARHCERAEAAAQTSPVNRGTGR